MRHTTHKENDGSTKITIEFGVTEHQKKLETAVLTLLTAIEYGQSAMPIEEIGDKAVIEDDGFPTVEEFMEEPETVKKVEPKKAPIQEELVM